MTSANMTSYFDIWFHPISYFDWPDVSYFFLYQTWPRPSLVKKELNLTKLF